MDKRYKLKYPRSIPAIFCDQLRIPWVGLSVTDDYLIAVYIGPKHEINNAPSWMLQNWLSVRHVFSEETIVFARYNLAIAVGPKSKSTEFCQLPPPDDRLVVPHRVICLPDETLVFRSNRYAWTAKDKIDMLLADVIDHARRGKLRENYYRNDGHCIEERTVEMLPMSEFVKVLAVVEEEI